MKPKPKPHSRHLNKFLTVNAAASYLGVSASTLRNWDRAGKLKARRHPINGYRLYNKADLDKLLMRVGGRQR
ncbi:MAG: MerR family transcriptional regulator [Candidatus Binataceae bacterium]